MYFEVLGSVRLGLRGFLDGFVGRFGYGRRLFLEESLVVWSIGWVL